MPDRPTRPEAEPSGTEIEVTPEMIEAGTGAHYDIGRMAAFLVNQSSVSGVIQLASLDDAKSLIREMLKSGIVVAGASRNSSV